MGLSSYKTVNKTTINRSSQRSLSPTEQMQSLNEMTRAKNTSPATSENGPKQEKTEKREKIGNFKVKSA